MDRDLKRALALGFFVLLSAWSPRLAAAAEVRTAEQAARIVEVRDVKVQDGAVRGEIVNKSTRPIRDVELSVHYTWRWKNEFKPGVAPLGDVVYHTVEKEIPPGGTESFGYKPASPLPSRPDGYFEIWVSVAGVTEVVR